MFKKVLIPVDVSVPEGATDLLRTAKAMTAQWDSDLHVVTVIPSVGMPIVGSYFDANFEAENKKAAAAQLATVVDASGITAALHILSGTVYDKIIELAGTLGADLIVIGANQPALRDYLLGSNAARVVRHSKQSVLVVRGD